MKHQTIVHDGYKYSVESLVGATLNHKVKTVEIETLGLFSRAPNNDTFLSFVAHMKQTNEADLKYPIILAEDGTVLDGYHRIAKSMVGGKETIKYVIIKNADLPPFIEEVKGDAK